MLRQIWFLVGTLKEYILYREYVQAPSSESGKSFSLALIRDRISLASFAPWRLCARLLNESGFWEG
jgi:hypothetical protein